MKKLMKMLWLKWKYSLFLALFASTISTTSNAQEDFTWWQETHNWDGVSHWRKYLTVSPFYFGPNALPVPEMNNAQLFSGARFHNSFWSHHATGDNTYNYFTDFTTELFSDRVNFSVFWVPVEHYTYSPEERDRRAARSFGGSHFTTGDVNITTSIWLFKESKYRPDVVLRSNLRTASGGNLSDARYTDAAGYYFDLTFGKQIHEWGTENFIRAYSSHGFYVWQLYMDRQRQNDAYLFGLGIDLNVGSTLIKTQCTGYIGYIDDGDKPVLYRNSLIQSFEKFEAQFFFQTGLNDWQYRSVGLGITYKIANKKSEE